MEKIIFWYFLIMFSPVYLLAQPQAVFYKDELNLIDVKISQKITFSVRFSGKVTDVFVVNGLLNDAPDDLTFLDPELSGYQKSDFELYIAKTKQTTIKIFVFDNMIVIGSESINFLRKIIILRFNSKKKKERLGFKNFTLIEERFIPGLNPGVEIVGYVPLVKLEPL